MSNFWNKKLFASFFGLLLLVINQLQAGVNLELAEGQNQPQRPFLADEVIFIRPAPTRRNQPLENPLLPAGVNNPNLINLYSPSGKAKLLVLSLYFGFLFSMSMQKAYEDNIYPKQLYLGTKEYLAFSLVSLAWIHYNYLYYPRFRKYYCSFWYLIM